MAALMYLALLSGTVKQGALMGAVLAYRSMYYLLPLLGGLVMYAVLERYASAHPAEAVEQSEPSAPGGATASPPSTASVAS